MKAGTIEAVAIGVSTGGPPALTTIVSQLPKDIKVPIFIVQHMPATFTALLAERLSAAKGHDVVEATHESEVLPGQILIAPGDHHLTVSRKMNSVITRLNQQPQINSCRPSVDPLFESLAACYGKRCLGIILTGMGKDGTNGVRTLKGTGAPIIAQDEKTSVVWGMPGSVVQNGLADSILPIDQIGQTIVRAIKK